MNNIKIFPKGLEVAARTFAKKPAVVGEVLVALVAGEDASAGKALTEVQRYILAACREEIEETNARREATAVRKAKSRARQNAGRLGN